MINLTDKYVFIKKTLNHPVCLYIFCSVIIVLVLVEMHFNSDRLENKVPSRAKVGGVLCSMFHSYVQQD